MDKDCTCGSGRSLEACCGLYLSGAAVAPTAEALMRSRYSAFCQGKVDYLMATHLIQLPDGQLSPGETLGETLPEKRQATERLALRQSVNQTEWLNLLIVSTRKGKANDKKGVVEFVAAYRPKRLSIMGALPVAGQSQIAGQTVGQAAGPVDGLRQLHEKSRFVKADGRWFYTEGDSLPPYRPKPTQPCWCGRKQAFKQCHG